MRQAVALAALSLVLAAGASGAAAGQGQEPAESRLSVEVLGGAGELALADLNAFSLHREAVYSTYYEAQSRYYESLYRDSFTSSFTREGAFPIIQRSWTGGARVSYRFGRRLAATFGVEYLSRTRSASVRRTYATSAVNPDAVSFRSDETTTWEFEPNVVSVRAYTPMVGLRLAAWRRRGLRIDAVVQAGATWGTCRLEENSRSATTWYRLETETSTRLRGHGIGFSGEAGLRAAWDTPHRWGVFVEASYQRQRLTSVTGTADRTSRVQDGDATSVEREATTVVDGRWRMTPYAVTTAFVRLNQPYPDVTAGQNPAFALDLSGVRLRAGISLRFGRRH